MMRLVGRLALTGLVLAGFAMACGSAAQADESVLNARPRVTHPTHSAAHHHAKAARVVSGSSLIREAQTHLKNLGYAIGAADGVMGAKTRTALKSFQRKHGLVADGKVGKKTIAALRAADHGGSANSPRGRTINPFIPHALLGPEAMAATGINADDAYGVTDQNYADPLFMARHYALSPSRSIPNRFARLTITEQPQGQARFYSVTLNDQAVLQADHQPSVIGVSRTFLLGDEDGLILSTYRAGDSVCPTQHYLLILRNGGSAWYPIENCTRRYHAEIVNDLLSITFPEFDDKRAVGATWRYETGRLERL